jgi:dTDP-4-dehydrorhamnose 3,5-epimerase
VSSIPGVEVRTLTPHGDARGALREVWRASQQPVVLRQVLVTQSRASSLRGMHYHLKQADIWYVTAGRVFMALVDLRGPFEKQELRLGPDQSVLVPPMVAHGYLAETDATMNYLLTEESDGSDEFGFRYDDPEAKIAWPGSEPVLSPRDRDAGTFAAARAAVRAHRAPTRR